VISAALAVVVAVMPFKDLSGEKASIGAAISETVTSDLRAVPSVKVVERANVERVLGELDLQGRKSDLDQAAALKVGKLLQATMIVVGSYQRVGPDVRINARFVNVETTEVAGSAKVDGPQSSFFTLQDRITVELLKSAGIEQKHVQLFAKRVRPKLKSFRAVELYGDSVVETDDGKRKEILIAALKEDPAFVYASNDLDALEKRLKGYSASQQVAEDKRVKELKDQLAKETVGDKRAMLVSGILNALWNTHRYHQMLAEAKAIAAAPGAQPTTFGFQQIDETGLYYAVMAENYLHQWDAVVRDGEKFLKSYPSSPFYGGVQNYITGVISRRRKDDEGKKKLAELLANLTGTDRTDPCYLGDLHRSFAQFADAQHLFRVCLQLGKRSRKDVLHELVNADIELADWPHAREDIRALEKENDTDLPWLRSFWDANIPADG
jgi:TolB-like protein